ncbi:MAG: glycerophosphodiester phosphodiesterase family protein [Bacteroidales bacterium]
MKKFFLFAIILILSFPSCYKLIKESEPKIIIGHRGARGLLPENTLPGFIKSIEIGVDAVECDVFVTKDKKVIISHNPKISSIMGSNPDGSHVTKKQSDSLILYNMNYEDIVKFNIGLRQNPTCPEQKTLSAKIPLLTDLFETVKKFYNNHPEIRKRIVFFIEIKSWYKHDNLYTPPYDDYINSVMDVVQKHLTPRQVVIQTFDLRAMEFLNENYEEYTTQFLRASPGININLDSLSFTPKLYGSQLDQTNPKDYDTLLKKNIKLITWIPNSIPEMQKAFDILKSDGIGTDYPNLAVPRWGNPNRNLNAETLEFEEF